MYVATELLSQVSDSVTTTIVVIVFFSTILVALAWLFRNALSTQNEMHGRLLAAARQITEDHGGRLYDRGPISNIHMEFEQEGIIVAAGMAITNRRKYGNFLAFRIEAHRKQDGMAIAKEFAVCDVLSFEDMYSAIQQVTLSFQKK